MVICAKSLSSIQLSLWEKRFSRVNDRTKYGTIVICVFRYYLPTPHVVRQKYSAWQSS